MIAKYSNWKEIRKEIDKGQGSELKSCKGKRPKFCSLYSSTCLCVNSFAIMKSFPSKAEYLGFSNCHLLRFEEKVNTGISQPNLDVYLESSDGIIGIESKFTETLKPKLPNWKNKDSIGNLTNYLNRKTEIKNIPEGFAENVIEHYIDKKEKQHVDIAQLIKHTLGMIARGKGLGIKNTQLCYIYWLPHNNNSYSLYQKHNREIEEFKAVIEPFINFTHLSYRKFWSLLECDKEYAVVIQKLRTRYEIDV